MRHDMTGWPRVADDSPYRCKSGNRTGQCRLKAVDGSEYCPIHGGLWAERKRGEAAARRAMLRISSLGKRFDELRSDSDIKGLRDEIAVARGLLEVIMNRCKDQGDLAMRAGPIGTLLTQIEKLVTSAHRLDKELGEMLDKAQIEEFGRELIEIITRHVTDPATLEAIINDIGELEARRSNRVQ